MRMPIVFVCGILFAASAGCGGPALSTAPLTEEQKRQIKADDKKVDDEEKSGSGGAVPKKR